MPLVLKPVYKPQFLIPMAVSLAFGVLFATAVSLLLVPAACYVLADLEALVKRIPIRETRVRDSARDTVEKAYQFGFFSSGMEAPLRRSKLRPRVEPLPG